MIVRGLGRTREMAIRAALGASRLRVLRQLMVESVVLAAAGGICGAGVAYAALRAGAALMPDLRMVLPGGQSAGLTRVGLHHLGLDLTTLLAIAILTCLAALMFGLGPAWAASRRDLDRHHEGRHHRRGLGGNPWPQREEPAGRGRDGARAGAPDRRRPAGEERGSPAGHRAGLRAGRRSSRSAWRCPRRSTIGPRGSRFIIDLIDRLASRPDTGSVAFGSCAPLSGRMQSHLGEGPGWHDAGTLAQDAGRRSLGLAGVLRDPGDPGCSAAASSPGRIVPDSQRSSSSTRPRRAPTGPARIRSERGSRSVREDSRMGPR